MLAVRSVERDPEPQGTPYPDLGFGRAAVDPVEDVGRHERRHRLRIEHLHRPEAPPNDPVAERGQRRPPVSGPAPNGPHDWAAERPLEPSDPVDGPVARDPDASARR